MTNQPPPYNVNINLQTKFIFSTSGSSSSIVKHNDAIRKLGLNLVYFTIADEVTPERYAALVRSPIARGAAVTGRGGLKSTIIPFLDEVEPLAMKTQAVNTIVNNDGKLSGYNSDAIGLKTALTKGIEASGLTVKTAVIYGNGGVSGVAYHVLLELGIKATMAGRNPERVLEKKKQLGLEHVPDFDGPYDLIVDATPISSDPKFLNSPGLSKLLNGVKWCFHTTCLRKTTKQITSGNIAQKTTSILFPGN